MKIERLCVAGIGDAMQSASMRRVLSAGALAGLALLAAGCGGSTAPSVASLATTTGQTTAAPSSYLGARLRWAECIRKHGLPDFPDPNGQGEVNLAGININSPQFLASHQACRRLQVAVPPTQAAQIVRQELAVAECMRRHGVPSFPDPNSRGRFPGGWPQALTSTPVGARAAKICNPGTG